MISIADPRADREFLGEEFLTWIWYKIEVDGGLFELPHFGSVGLAFDRHLEFGDEPHLLVNRAEKLVHAFPSIGGLASGVGE